MVILQVFYRDQQLIDLMMNGLKFKVNHFGPDIDKTQSDNNHTTQHMLDERPLLKDAMKFFM